MATAARGGTNWFAIWVSVIVVAVVAALIVVVVVMNTAASAPAPRPDGAGVNQETGAISVGNGPNEVDVYFDFYCPHCQDFERSEGKAFSQALEDGDITLNLFPAALSGLNQASGTDFSKRSANAMYCVAEADPTAVYPFFTSVFATNPSGAGLTDEQLASMAADAGVTGIEDCLAERPWDDLVAEVTSNIPANPDTGQAGTPTLLVNGEYVPVTLDPQLDLLDRLN